MGEGFFTIFNINEARVVGEEFDVSHFVVDFFIKNTGVIMSHNQMSI